MRAGPIIAGSILLLVGLAAVVGGGVMQRIGDACIEVRCGDGDVYMMAIVGRGIFLGGALAGLAGIGLLVAGVVTDAKPRNVPVEGAPRTRACPSCSEPAGYDARYCPACGTAIAPILAPRQ